MHKLSYFCVVYFVKSSTISTTGGPVAQTASGLPRDRNGEQTTLNHPNHLGTHGSIQAGVAQTAEFYRWPQ